MSGQLRMSTRLFGVAGYVLLYAYFTSRKRQQSPWMRRAGEIAVGVSIMASTYAVLQIAEDREAFLKLVPFGRVTLFLYATVLGSVGLCYIPGLFVYDVTIGLVVLLSAATLGVDMRMWYWTQRRGLDYWNHVRMVIDNLAMVTGGLLYLACAERKLPPLPVEELPPDSQSENDQLNGGVEKETTEKKLN